MSSIKMPVLKIGKLEAKIPIIQGGMSIGISLSELSSAVANEGGIGVIGTAGIGMLEPDYANNFREANDRALRQELRKAKSLSKGIIGVNILAALSDADYLALTAMEEGADFILIGAGLPLKISDVIPKERHEEYFEKVIPIVSSARAAKIIFQYWEKEHKVIPNAVIVEGPLAGGHLGFKQEQIDNPEFTLEKILPEVITLVRSYEDRFQKKIAVVAAGGIYTGGDICKFLSMGADGVQMATRFVATYECDASMKFKEEYINCSKENIIIIDSPVGLPGRAIKNQYLIDVARGLRKPFKCPWKCLKTCDYTKAPYCIALALANAKKGITEAGFCFVGANAYRIDKILSVKELIKSLIDEYELACAASSSA